MGLGAALLSCDHHAVAESFLFCGARVFGHVSSTFKVGALVAADPSQTGEKVSPSAGGCASTAGMTAS